MTALSIRPQGKFYLHAEPHKIAVEDACGICKENFISSTTKTHSQSAKILVHRNDKTPDGYSCAMHRECLSDWMEIQQICPLCRYPANIDKSTYTLRERAETALKDAMYGGFLAISVPVYIIVPPLMSRILQSNNMVETSSKIVYLLATSKSLHRLALAIFSGGAMFSIGVRHAQKKGWMLFSD